MTIPKEILHIITHYATLHSGDKEAMDAMVTAIFPNITQYQRTVMRNFICTNIVPSGNQAIKTPIATPSASLSPHAPVKRPPKDPFWIKEIKSYDPSCVSGFGLKGKLVTKEEVGSLDPGRYVVVKVRGTKDDLYLCVPSKASVLSIKTFRGVEGIGGLGLINMFPSYKELFDSLELRGVDKVQPKTLAVSTP